MLRASRAAGRARLSALGWAGALAAALLWVAVAGSAGPAALGGQESPAAGAATKGVSGPRELLDLFGAGDAVFDALADGGPLTDDEREPLLRILAAVRRFSLLDIDRWKLDGASPRRLAADPQHQRGNIFELSGRVTHVAPAELPAEMLTRFDLARVYRCRLEIGEPASPATVYALAVPRQWKLDAPVDERVSVRGFFLKLSGDESGPQPIFAAQRVAWYPKNVLGDLKMDVGLFDQVLPRGAITQSAPGAEKDFSDLECFYQLLAAAGRAGAGDLPRLTAGRRDRVIPLLQNPRQHAGKLLSFAGTARRALPVRVEDPDIVERFGIDHYYEVEVSVELEELLNVDGQLRSSFPMVFCVRELPGGMPGGERISEPVRIAAFFLKVWTYRSEESKTKGPDARQWAPLLIGREAEWIGPPPPGSAVPAALAGALFVIVTAALWWIAWRLTRIDDRHVRRTIARKFAPAPGELKHLDEPGRS